MPRFATSWPTDEFDSGIEGVPVITLRGTDVDDAHVEELQDLAHLSGVALVEVDPDAPPPGEQLFTQSTTTPAAPAVPVTAPVPATTPEG